MDESSRDPSLEEPHYADTLSVDNDSDAISIHSQTSLRSDRSISSSKSKTSERSETSGAGDGVGCAAAAGVEVEDVRQSLEFDDPADRTLTDNASPEARDLDILDDIPTVQPDPETDIPQPDVVQPDIVQSSKPRHLILPAEPRAQAVPTSAEAAPPQAPPRRKKKKQVTQTTSAEDGAKPADDQVEYSLDANSPSANSPDSFKIVFQILYNVILTIQLLF